MTSCKSHSDGRRRLLHHALLLAYFTLTVLALTSPVTSAPPTLRSVAGCVADRLLAIACHTGTPITLTGSNYLVNDRSTVVNLGPYRCLNVTTLSSTSIRCIVPPVSPADIERRLDVNVTVNGSTSAVLRQGVQSYGQLSLLSVVGCANTTNVGTPSAPIYRSSGCWAEERVTIVGSGFGSANSVRVTIGDRACGDTTAPINGTQMTCTLPVTTPGVWLAVRVTVGLDWVLQEGMIQLSAAPYITAVSGCLAVNGTRTGLCHTNQVVTIRGANFQAPLSSVYIGPYACLTPRLNSSSSITCTLPAISTRDEGLFLNVTVRLSNISLTLPSAVQSYGLLSVTQVRGCAAQTTLNGTIVSSGCVPGTNLTILGSGFIPGQTVVLVQDYRYPCSSVVYLSRSMLICVNAQLPSLADVLVPIVVGVTAFTPNFFVTSVPLLSFSVTPRVTDISGCIVVSAGNHSTASECHPNDPLTLFGSNYTSQAVAYLVGLNRNYFLPSNGQTSRTRLSVQLPSSVDAVDERRPLAVGVQVGLSNSTLQQAVWMVNALQVISIWGCVNQTSYRGANLSTLCVAGMPIYLTGNGFTASSVIHVVAPGNVWVPSEQCVLSPPRGLSCRLPRLTEPVLSGSMPVSLVSGTANLYPLDFAVSYIPTPVLSRLSASSGCTYQRGQPLKDCTTGAAVTLTGTGFVPFTTVELFTGSRADTVPTQCASLRFVSSGSVVCTLPSFATVAPNTWLSIKLNSSLPTVAGPSSFMAEALLFAGEAPAALPGDTRWGLSVDELVIVIIAVAVIVLLLLGLQLLWCLSRLAGVRFPRLERLCPKLMAAMRGPRPQGEDRGDIGVGLLQYDGHEQLRFDALHPQPSEGHRTPYVPFAAAAYTAQPAAEPMGEAGYRAYHLPPNLHNAHLVPPASYAPL